jgi:2-polyprenyl-3-methyl-5-hydroxy-6-metoxy-1,4-benzoquinol methylase
MFDFHHEENSLKHYFEKIPKGSKILDVGSGQGRNLRLLKSIGLDQVTGVEVNPELISISKNLNFKVVSPEELKNNKIEKFDVILFAHILEHFQPEPMKVFLENYLSFLKKDGKVVILTPVPNPSFYNDFDHVRPYLPIAFEMVFGENKLSQVQYVSHYSLKRQYLKFLRGPYRIRYSESLYSESRSFSWYVNFFLKFLYWLTRGHLGETIAWLGVYEKK